MHRSAFFSGDLFYALFLIFNFSELCQLNRLNVEITYVFSVWNIWESFTVKVKFFHFLTLSSFPPPPITVLILAKNPIIFYNKTCSEDAITCPQSWSRINNNCFFQSEREKTWMDGQTKCTAHSGSLAIFNSKNEVVRCLLCNIHSV